MEVRNCEIVGRWRDCQLSSPAPEREFFGVLCVQIFVLLDGFEIFQTSIYKSIVIEKHFLFLFIFESSNKTRHSFVVLKDKRDQRWSLHVLSLIMSIHQHDVNQLDQVCISFSISRHLLSRSFFLNLFSLSRFLFQIYIYVVYISYQIIIIIIVYKCNILS